MNRGDRVVLLRKVAKGLANLEDWTEIDLVLDQFDLPQSDLFNGTQYQYALAMLRRAPDDTLVALHGHLFSNEPLTAVPASLGAGPWRPGCFRLFLSHVSAKRAFVSDVKHALLPLGIDAFVAHEDIVPTKDWQVEIEAALGTCDSLAAFLTAGFRESLWCEQEVGYCLGRHVVVVPICLDLDPYGLMGRYQGVRGKGIFPSDIAQKLYKILLKNPRTTAKVSEAYCAAKDERIVSEFEQSPSFAAARQRAQRLADINAWTPGLLERIQAAAAQNDQIKRAYGVDEIIRNILAEHSQLIA